MPSSKRIVRIFMLIFSLAGAIETLVFVANLSQSYEPTTEGAINYLSEILVFLVRDAIISFLVSLPLDFFLELIKELT